jgi:hypothetical protein
MDVAMMMTLLGLVAFGLGLGTVVLGVRYGMVWTDLHRVARKDSQIIFGVCTTALCSVAFIFAATQFVDTNLENTKPLGWFALAGALGLAFCFRDEWKTLIEAAQKEKEADTPEAKEKAKKQEAKSAYDRMESLRRRATGKDRDDYR